MCVRSQFAKVVIGDSGIGGGFIGIGANDLLMYFCN